MFIDISDNVLIMKHYRYTPTFMHKHDFFEIAYVYEGSCINSFDGITQRLSAGDFCFIAPNTNHSISFSVIMLVKVFSNTVFLIMKFIIILSSYTSMEWFVFGAIKQKSPADSL